MCEGLKEFQQQAEEDPYAPSFNENGCVIASEGENYVWIRFCPFCGVKLEPRVPKYEGSDTALAKALQEARIGDKIMEVEKETCTLCGEAPAMHIHIIPGGEEANLCCRCHIAKGGIPADWHKQCMLAERDRERKKLAKRGDKNQ
jgi:hypothetical protein